jgi:anti-sigma factor ChrR (cupin superfamily)
MYSDHVYAHAVHALPSEDAPGFEAHLATCERCRDELAATRRITDRFVDWPTDVLRPSTDLRQRLARRIADDTGGDVVLPQVTRWLDAPWKNVAPGIACRLLSTDKKRNLVSMLVRLDPGASYPAHVHASVEELHLLSGELWIDDRKLHPGDYNRGEPGDADHRVWSETGCTCVLITSTQDVLMTP